MKSRVSIAHPTGYYELAISASFGVFPFKPVINLRANIFIGLTFAINHKPKRRTITIGSQLLEKKRSRKSVKPRIARFCCLRQLS